MTIRFVCPNAACGTRLKAENAYAGKPTRCTRCRTQVRVPVPVEGRLEPPAKPPLYAPPALPAPAFDFADLARPGPAPVPEPPPLPRPPRRDRRPRPAEPADRIRSDREVLAREFRSRARLAGLAGIGHSALLLALAAGCAASASTDVPRALVLLLMAVGGAFATLGTLAWSGRPGALKGLVGVTIGWIALQVAGAIYLLATMPGATIGGPGLGLFLAVGLGQLCSKALDPAARLAKAGEPVRPGRRPWIGLGATAAVLVGIGALALVRGEARDRGQPDWGGTASNTSTAPAAAEPPPAAPPGGAGPPTPAGPFDPAWNGTWRLDKLYDDYGPGKKSYLMLTTTYLMAVRDGQATVTTTADGPKTEEYVVEADRSHSPARFRRYRAGDRDRKGMSGIYEFRAGALWLCTQADGSYPDAFQADPADGKGRRVYEFVREKASGNAPAPAPTPAADGPVTISAHPAGVVALAVTPDGKAIVTAGKDGSLAVWGPDGKPRAGMKALGKVRCLAVSPDGRRAAVGFEDQDAGVWDFAAGSRVADLKVRAEGLAFAADGRELFARAPGKVTVWEAGNWAKVREIRPEAVVEAGGTYSSFVALAGVPAPDGKAFYAGYADGCLRAWDATGKRTRTFGEASARTRETVWATALSADGGRLAGLYDDQTVRLWQTGSGRLGAAATFPEKNLVSVAVGPDRLAAGSRDGTIYLWDPTSPTASRVLTGHGKWLTGLAFTSAGALVSAGMDGTVRVWPPAVQAEAKTGPALTVPKTDEAAPPKAKDPPPVKDKPVPPKSPAGPVRLSDLKIERTTADPPSVRFTVKVDLKAAELLETWASVDVPNPGEVLKVFAGSLYQGLLSFTVDGVTIDLANPPPTLKAQRVALKKSDTDPTVYVGEAKFPQVKAAGASTTFGLMLAAQAGDKVVQSNAVTVRVNLKTGEVEK